MNKAMIESYVRNLLGQVIGAAVVVSQATGVSFANFGQHEVLLVANALWASLVPVVIRYFNKKDPAFGRVVEIGLAELTKKLAVESAPAKSKKPKRK